MMTIGLHIDYMKAQTVLLKQKVLRSLLAFHYYLAWYIHVFPGNIY
jgi:hypothetical protein